MPDAPSDLRKHLNGEKEDDMTEKTKPKAIPSLFATIHFQSDKRPNGYTDDDIAQLNERANREDGASHAPKAPTKGKPRR